MLRRKTPMKKIFSFMIAIAVMVGLQANASSDVIVDFTLPGGSTGGLIQGATGGSGGPFTFSSTGTSSSGTTITLDFSVDDPGAPAPMGANNQGASRQNGGLGSGELNTGDFLNITNAGSEVLRFDLTSVTGLAPGETINSIVLTQILSQNGNSQNADQSGGFGGTFGNLDGDGFLVSPDGLAGTVVDSTDNDLGSILLATDAGDATNTGNTFGHAANVTFADFLDIQLSANNAQAAVVQGFRIDVNTTVAVPEPTSAVLLGLGGLGLVLRRRRS